MNSQICTLKSRQTVDTSMRKEIGSSQGRTKATILIVIIYPVHFYTSGLFPLIMSL